MRVDYDKYTYSKFIDDQVCSKLYCSVNGEEIEVWGTSEKPNAYPEVPGVWQISRFRLMIYDREGHYFKAYAYAKIKTEAV